MYTLCILHSRADDRCASYLCWGSPTLSYSLIKSVVKLQAGLAEVAGVLEGQLSCAMPVYSAASMKHM